GHAETSSGTRRDAAMSSAELLRRWLQAPEHPGAAVDVEPQLRVGVEPGLGVRGGLGAEQGAAGSGGGAGSGLDDDAGALLEAPQQPRQAAAGILEPHEVAATGGQLFEGAGGDVVPGVEVDELVAVLEVLEQALAHADPGEVDDGAGIEGVDVHGEG